MKRILALAAVAVALPSTALAQSAPVTAASAAPAVVAHRDHDRDGGHEHTHKRANGCGDLSNLSSRGTVTYSACAVPKNHTLIQAGYNNLSVKGVGHVATYPDSLIRVGTSVQNLELDFVPPTIERVNPAVGRRTGVSDMGAGLTYQLPTFFAPIRATVNGAVYAPTADQGFGSRTGSNYQYGLNLGSTLGTFNIGGTVGFQSTIDPLTGMRYQSFVPSLTIGDKVGFGKRPGTVFVEAARFSRIDPFGNPELLYTGGYKQPISKRASLDAEYSESPNVLGERAHSVGAGLGYLF
jgi:hypothetical protein